MDKMNFSKKPIGTCLTVILMLAFVTSAIPQNRYMGSDSRYVFQPGDGIRLKVWQLIPQDVGANLAKELNTDYTIDGDGYALFPIVGKIKVTGMTPDKLTNELEEKFSPYLKEPVMFVLPLIRVILNGSFLRPGTYRVKPNSSLWEAIELAEGVTTDCDLKKIRVERGGKVVKTDLLSQLENGYSISELGIRSGDQIIAPDKGSISFRQIRDYLTFFMTAYMFYTRVSKNE